jgi:hypothetical protein
MIAGNDSYDREGEYGDEYVATSPLERLAASFDHDYYNHDNNNRKNNDTYDVDDNSNDSFPKAPYNSPYKTTDVMKNGGGSTDIHNYDCSYNNNNNKSSNNNDNNNCNNHNEHNTNDSKNAHKLPDKQKKAPSDLDTLLGEFNELMIKLQEPESKTLPNIYDNANIEGNIKKGYEEDITEDSLLVNNNNNDHNDNENNNDDFNENNYEKDNVYNYRSHDNYEEMPDKINRNNKNINNVNYSNDNNNYKNYEKNDIGTEKNEKNDLKLGGNIPTGKMFLPPSLSESPEKVCICIHEYV